MFKVGDLFVLKEGGQTLKIKAITNDRSKVRTFRAIKGTIWIPTSLIREATIEEQLDFRKAMKEIRNIKQV